jgi:hypothetical protein
VQQRIRFWQRWLAVATIVVAIFGLALVLVPSLGGWLFGLLLFGSTTALDGLGARADAYLRLVHGVLGAVMFGWAVALLMVVVGPFSHLSRFAWSTIAASLALWFLADTTLSLALGFWPNAVLNALLVFLFAVPLGATFDAFHRRGPERQA